MFDGQSLLEIIKLGFRPRIALAFWLTPLVIFSLPDPWAEYVRIQTFRDEYGAFITIAFILFFLLWIIELVCFFSPQVYSWHRNNQELKETFSGLNHDELTLLFRFVEAGSRTQNCRPDWQEVQSLVRKDILMNVGDEGVYSVEPYSVTSKAWSYLKKNKNKFLEDAITANPSLKERKSANA